MKHIPEKTYLLSAETPLSLRPFIEILLNETDLNVSEKTPSTSSELDGVKSKLASNHHHIDQAANNEE